jgi:glycerol-3-phosphate dehydrogenase (NAD(P)+)
MANVTLVGAGLMGLAVPKLAERGILKPGELPLMGALVDMVVHGLPVSLPFVKFFGGWAHV